MLENNRYLLKRTCNLSVYTRILTCSLVLLSVICVRPYLLFLVHGQTWTRHTKLEEEHDEQNDHVLEKRTVKETTHLYPEPQWHKNTLFKHSWTKASCLKSRVMTTSWWVFIARMSTSTYFNTFARFRLPFPLHNNIPTSSRLLIYIQSRNTPPFDGSCCVRDKQIAKQVDE